MKITLLDGLNLDSEGYLVNNNKQYIHLRQGDMDGACGPYCVVMALLALNKIKNVDISPQEKIDYRTNIGKILREIHNLDPLVLCGATAEDLCRILLSIKSIDHCLRKDSSKRILQQAKESVLNGHPVILDVRSRNSESLYHWVLAVGASDSQLFLLDPAHELRSANFWNSTLTTEPSTTRFGYRYTNPYCCHDVEVSTTIEVI